MFEKTKKESQKKLPLLMNSDRKKSKIGLDWVKFGQNQRMQHSKRRKLQQ